MPRTNNSISVAQFRIESEINEVQLSVNQEKRPLLLYMAMLWYLYHSVGLFILLYCISCRLLMMSMSPSDAFMM